MTGFSHNTGNLARSRENPFPSPRAVPAPPSVLPPSPPLSSPHGSAPAPRHGGSPAGAEQRGADPGWDATAARGDGQGVGAQAWWEAPFPRGIPIDVARDSARAAEAGMRAGHLLDRPAALPAWL